jgi:cytoskeleton protein RodZ
MSSIGETLRRERLRRNLDLEQISRELKISRRFLDAIEEERFDRLPASVFAKSFVRQYASMLGLDPEEMAAEVQRAMEPPSLEENPARPDVPPINDLQLPRVENWEAVGDKRRFEWTSSLPALGLLVVVLLVCSGIYTLWQKARQPVTAQVTAPPVETAPAPPTPQPQPEVQPPQTEASTPASPEAAPAQPPVAAEGAPKQQAATAPAPSPVLPPAQTPAIPADRPAATPGPVHVEVTAAEAVWVLARADGKYLFSGTLEPNQSRAADANEKLILRVGNAGGVTITLNGKPIGAIGPKGQVREVQFTSGGFQIVAGPKPSLPEDNPI